MDFKNKTSLTQIFEKFFSTYRERVPYVNKITKAMIKKNLFINQSDILNDHVAFRILGVNCLGIKSFEKI